MKGTPWTINNKRLNYDGLYLLTQACKTPWHFPKPIDAVLVCKTCSLERGSSPQCVLCNAASAALNCWCEVDRAACVCWELMVALPSYRSAIHLVMWGGYLEASHDGRIHMTDTTLQSWICAMGCDGSILLLLSLSSLLLLCLFCFYLCVLYSMSVVVCMWVSEDNSWEPVLFFTMWDPEI